jgi:hypothetical protein
LNVSEDAGQEGPPLRAGEVYGPLLVSLLSEQAARKASIEQRALAVITTSGVLVSLLAALSALVAGKTTALRLHTGPRAALIAAVAAFVAAAIVALITNAPRGYRDFAPEDVDRMLKEWDSSGEDARWLVSQANADHLKRAAKVNGNKALLLQVAVGAEVAAVSLVALGVVLTLI